MLNNFVMLKIITNDFLLITVNQLLMKSTIIKTKKTFIIILNNY